MPKVNSIIDILFGMWACNTQAWHTEFRDCSTDDRDIHFYSSSCAVRTDKVATESSFIFIPPSCPLFMVTQDT
jgi:hypothetical protein